MFEIMKFVIIDQQPNPTMGAACSNSNKIVQATIKKTGKGRNSNGDDEPDGVVCDPNSQYQGDGNVERMHEQLWRAVEANDRTAADKFLELNDIQESNLYDPFGQSMLHRAAQLGFTEMLMLLIERTGAKPDLANSNLATPLHLACRSNREAVVKFLIGCGVDANQQDEHGQTPLLICCIHGHKDILSLLIEASIVGHLPEPIEVDLPNHQGLTPLNCAAIKGDFEIVKCLVTRGGAKVDQSSPKGCTPLIYAGRGGYSNVVEFLLQKKASALKQDNAGGTVLHHAIEKGHLNVLETMLQHGIDVYSAIEIADNAGRTPLFEAVENLNDENSESGNEIIRILTRSKELNGYGANPNVINYNGQTPLFSATRQGQIDAVKTLLEAKADPDLHSGEMVKPEDDEEDEEYDSLQEKYFMEAFKNCMTPLHVASVLGYDDIAILLVLEYEADPNIQSKTKGFTALHLSVLANKPEMLIELLTKTQADPMIEDTQGRTLLDMVYQFIPSYVDTFQTILENLSVQRINSQHIKQSTVARHYVHADDERKITGAKTQEQIQQMYAKEMELKEEDNTGTKAVNLATIDENDLITDVEIDERIENVFGRKVALCLVSSNWQYKELALKFVFRTSEKFLTRAEVGGAMAFTLSEMVDGTLAAVSLTCRDKVIKVFNVSLQLFNMVVQSSRVERDVAAVNKIRTILKKEGLIQKFLLQSEQSNTRVTNKIHEALLDLSFQAQLGEELVASAALALIEKHNSQNSNPKGLLAQLALLYKLVNSFDVKQEISGEDEETSLSKPKILNAVLPAVNHTKDDIRNAAVKILVDLQQRTQMFQLEDLNQITDKTKESLWEKMQEVQAEGDEVKQPVQQQKKLNVVTLELSKEGEKQIEANIGKLTEQALEKFKQLIQEKGSHKDWTQREIALSAMQECFSLHSKGMFDQEEQFLGQCTILLQSSLDDNNMQIYLIAVDVAAVFIKKVANTEAVLDALPSLLQALVLRTTDTNTRIRKRSVDVINQIWDLQLNKKSNENASQIVANVLCDPGLNEKAIIGRLGLLIKKALLIENKEDISKKPLLLILGKDYEQLIQFACSWCLHKNTKVRQCALKLAVEICRLNSIDQRGVPFKQRIINYILGLRSSIRDPLIKKINEVCKLASDNSKDYINEAEFELTLATKTRAASLDVRRAIGKNLQQKEESLPQIGGGNQLPQVQSEFNARPTIVLPHSEPISDTIKEQWSSIIELFGLDLVTCLNSQTWSSRNVAIQKVEEQLFNLDPNRRDAMLCEINRNNLPPEVSFKIVLKLVEEGLKDPVLKNYIAVLDLIQKALPIYFRYLRPEQIRRELTPLIQSILAKTSDLKQKVREASLNFCLYLSHQSPIGPEAMINTVVGELNLLQWDKLEAANAQKKEVTNTFGNSNMIASCLKLLGQFQQQTSLVTQTSALYPQYTTNINKALKHSNPQVRKEGEALFCIMYETFKEVFIKELKDQKPQIVQKLLAEVKAQTQEQQNAQANLPVSQISKEQHDKVSVQHAQMQLRDDYLSQPSIQALLKGNEDKLHQLKLPNPKKRLIAIVEIKKAIQQKLNQISIQNARDLVEPLSLLMRHLLRDENAEVYLESLNLLKFIVGSLAQHLSTLDLHLMMGQFIGVIVSGSNQNMRQRVASDKVIVFFAKHNNIGSYIVAKEVLKNIERLNKSALVKTPIGVQSEEELEERKQVLSRFYGILQMLIQQFSIVLCYQPDFYQKLLESLAETMSKAADEPSIKSNCQQLVVSLFQIDAKLLDQGVQQLDFTKKTHLKKIIIELENSSQKGQQVLMPGNQHFISAAGGGQGTSRLGSPDASFRDTQQSFTSQNTRQTIMSPGAGLSRRLNRDRNSEIRSSKTLADGPAPIISETPHEVRKATIDQSSAGISWLDRKTSDANKTVSLPSIDEPNTRKRQLGQGFIGNLGSGKAAGFNRNDFNQTGNYSNTKTGGILDYDFNSIAANNGLGSGLIPTNKNKNDISQLSSARKPLNPMEMTSPNFAVNPQFTTSDIETKTGAAVRPPLYVLTQLQKNVLKRPEGYQPTLIERTNQLTAKGEQGQAIERGSGSSQRYKQPNQLPGLTSTSFGTAQMQSTTSTTGYLPSFSNQNQNNLHAVAPTLPEAATFQINKVTDAAPTKRPSQYRDVLNN